MVGLAAATLSLQNSFSIARPGCKVYFCTSEEPASTVHLRCSDVFKILTIGGCDGGGEDDQSSNVDGSAEQKESVD